MNIEELIRKLSKALGETMLNKKEKNNIKININKMDSTDIFKIILNKSISSGDYNRAENLIFEELEKNNSSEIYKLAIEFYNLLLEKSDDELNKNNFTREEVYQGLNDLKKFDY